MQEVTSTRSTAAAALAVGSSGHCIASMVTTEAVTTHCSEVRAEMPSGMVPIRELEDKSRFLHSGQHMHIPGYSWPPSTLHTTHA